MLTLIRYWSRKYFIFLKFNGQLKLWLLVNKWFIKAIRNCTKLKWEMILLGWHYVVHLGVLLNSWDCFKRQCWAVSFEQPKLFLLKNILHLCKPNKTGAKPIHARTEVQMKASFVTNLFSTYSEKCPLYKTYSDWPTVNLRLSQQCKYNSEQLNCVSFSNSTMVGDWVFKK